MRDGGRGVWKRSMQTPGDADMRSQPRFCSADCETWAAAAASPHRKAGLAEEPAADAEAPVFGSPPPPLVAPLCFSPANLDRRTRIEVGIC